jgi:hypothetical protein
MLVSNILKALRQYLTVGCVAFLLQVTSSNDQCTGYWHYNRSTRSHTWPPHHKRKRKYDIVWKLCLCSQLGSRTLSTASGAAAWRPWALSNCSYVSRCVYVTSTQLLAMVSMMVSFEQTNSSLPNSAARQADTPIKQKMSQTDTCTFSLAHQTDTSRCFTQFSYGLLLSVV